MLHVAPIFSVHVNLAFNLHMKTTELGIGMHGCNSYLMYCQAVNIKTYLFILYKLYAAMPVLGWFGSPAPINRRGKHYTPGEDRMMGGFFVWLVHSEKCST